MAKPHFFAWFALLLVCPAGISFSPAPQELPTQPPVLEVTFISNEGFLVTVGEDKLLVDALHENPRGYSRTPPEVRELIARNEPPMDGIDLLVASHQHTDHFSPGLVHTFLQQSPKTLFATTTPTLSLFRDSVTHRAPGVDERLREINPAWGDSQSLHFGEGGEARFLTLNHLPEGSEPLLSLGTLATMGGRTILHLADLYPPTSVAYLEGYELEEETIDVLFADPWFVTSQEGQRLIREVIRPKSIVLMHLRPSDWKDQEDEVMALWPHAVVFADPLERREF
jgi:L-ascorbate metabolism protein UlaG (beta-lactamase superfamily)